MGIDRSDLEPGCSLRGGKDIHHLAATGRKASLEELSSCREIGRVRPVHLRTQLCAEL